MATPNPKTSKSITKKNVEGYEFQMIGYWSVETGSTCYFGVFKPSSASEKPPLVVSLHGVGGTPEVTFNWAKICENATRYGYVVLCPHGFTHTSWYGSRGSFHCEDPKMPEFLGDLAEGDILNSIGIVRRQFNIDPHRMYMMGQSMGASGALHFLSKYPEFWGAGVAVSPNTWCINQVADSPDILKPMKDIPMLMMHGTNDLIVNAENDIRPFIQAMYDMGMSYRYVEVEQAGHIEFGPLIDICTQAFEHFNKYAKRKPAPPIIRPSVQLHFNGYDLPAHKTTGPDNAPITEEGDVDKYLENMNNIYRQWSRWQSEEIFITSGRKDKQMAKVPTNSDMTVEFPFVGKSKPKGATVMEYSTGGGKTETVTWV